MPFAPISFDQPVGPTPTGNNSNGSMAKKTHQQQRERSWPSPQDYNEALQNPDFSFNDPELRRCVPETDALGFPRPTSGAFASVYRVECGECSYAVRCFFRGIQDQKERYAHISQYIASDDLPYTVKFEYQERGIRIGGSWFPIVKMDWVAGETLDKYVTRHSNHRKKWSIWFVVLRQCAAI